MYGTKSGEILDRLEVEVRCRLVATQAATSEGLDDTVMGAWLLLAIASLGFDENEAHDWIVGFGMAVLLSVTQRFSHDVRAHVVVLEQLPEHGVDW